MLSMTGYGKAEYTDGGIDLLIEIKTVNNRNFDINIKTPRAFICYEDLIRKTVQSYVRRGRIDLFVTFKDKREIEGDVQVNLSKAKGYYSAGKEIAEELGIENDVTVNSLLKFPDVLDSGTADYSGLEDVISDTVSKACFSLNQMRRIEGEKISADMIARMDIIESTRRQIVTRAPKVVEDYRVKLKERIAEALKDVKYDEARLLNEVAVYTDRVNIDEELTRLSSHISQFKEIIKEDGTGKKLDFLMQEFARESNTICSKSNDIEVTTLALTLKNEIEKVREQVQNLE